MKKFLLAIGLVLATAVAVQAQFRGAVPNTGNLVSGSNVSIAASGTTNLTGVIPVGDKGFALFPVFTNATTSTSGITFAVYVTADGTNYTTSSVQTNIIACNNTTAVKGYISVTNADNVVGAKVYVTNGDGSNAVGLTSLRWVSW